MNRLVREMNPSDTPRVVATISSQSRWFKIDARYHETTLWTTEKGHYGIFECGLFEFDSAPTTVHISAYVSNYQRPSSTLALDTVDDVDDDGDVRLGPFSNAASQLVTPAETVSRHFLFHRRTTRTTRLSHTLRRQCLSDARLRRRDSPTTSLVRRQPEYTRALIRTMASQYQVRQHRTLATANPRHSRWEIRVVLSKRWSMC